MTAAPDLVITEFSNDVTMDVDVARESYQELADLFGSTGIEWAILSPGYVRPGARSPCSFWMMGLEAENGVMMEQDPRPYTEMLRAFVALRAEPGVAVADASRLWGRLYRVGIPCASFIHL